MGRKMANGGRVAEGGFLGWTLFFESPFALASGIGMSQ